MVPLNLIFILFTLLNIHSAKFAREPAPFVKIGRMPGQVTESSGLELTGNGNLYTINDAGNGPVLFKIDATGSLIEAIKIPGAVNKDWEDLARDTDGNIYIGDTGNNSNNRTTLRIYKTAVGKEIKVSEINFRYEDQKKEKEKKRHHNFDCEAMFWNGGNLYLISKDRGPDKTAKVYQLPDQPGTYEAKLIARRNLDVMITAADISPDGKKVGLLGRGKLLIFEVNGPVKDFIKASPRVYNLPGTGQIEGLVFSGNNSVFFSNEEGNLYQFSF